MVSCEVQAGAEHTQSRGPGAKAAGVPSGAGSLGPEPGTATDWGLRGTPANRTWLLRDRVAPRSQHLWALLLWPLSRFLHQQNQRFDSTLLLSDVYMSLLVA